MKIPLLIYEFESVFVIQKNNSCVVSFEIFKDQTRAKVKEIREVC